MQYQATIEDPNVYTRPWTISMPLYRRVEPNMQLGEFKCEEFVGDLVYGKYQKEITMRNLLVAALVAFRRRSLGGAGDRRVYKVPRTPDGQPDFQGYWTNLTYTPYERPKELANKPFYTEKEAIDAFNKAVADSQNQVVHYVNTDFGATPVQTGAQAEPSHVAGDRSC